MSYQNESIPLLVKNPVNYTLKLTNNSSTDSVAFSTNNDDDLSVIQYKSSKMSKKQWFVLLCLYVMYILAGAAIFFYIEAKEEHKRASDDIAERKNIEILLRKHFQGNYSERKHLFKSLTNYCGKPLDVNMGEDPYDYKWDFYHSVFFVVTVVSTIGYGNLAPTVMLTRIFMIFYALIGIPMNGIVIYTLGDFFGKSFKRLHQRWKNSKLEAKIDYATAKLGLIGQVILYLIPGFTFFIFLPSTIMTVFEGWNYDVSVYYSFVSLTTIGFGDYVAGVTDTYGFGVLYTVYKYFLLVWIIGGMGYVVMILSFITNGMRSKNIKRIEHMLAENIRNTPKKIRGELRTLLHELLFMKVKPVYKGEFEYVPSTLERSQSCPDLTMYKKESPNMARKRAMSECYRAVNFQRIQSDTDLNRIDKERTFMPTNDIFGQTELLFKVVNALSSESVMSYENDGGVHGFSDKSILSSEFYQAENNPKKRRALSDVRSPSILLHEAVNGHTWYGADADNAINEYKKRQRSKSVFEFKKLERENIFKRIRNRLMSKDESSYQDIEKQKINDSMKVSSSEAPPNLYIRRESLLSSSAPQQQQDCILEQTSIAAFIRALSAVSAQENLQDTEKESTSPRVRRHGIITVQTRRASFIPSLDSTEYGSTRRFSLKPSDENLLKDIVKRKERSRKISSVIFQDERRGSQEARRRKISTTLPPDYSEQETPHYSSSLPQRKFSVRPVNVSSIVSPVQKQLQKRERTDSLSK